MRNFALRLGCLLSIFTFVCVATAEAGLTNSGRIQQNFLILRVSGTLDNPGELIGNNSANIICDTLSGNGLISSPHIVIRSKIVAFTGTIDCSENCVIITSTPLNETQFQYKGNGELKVIIADLDDLSSERSVKDPMSNYVITDGSEED